METADFLDLPTPQLVKWVYSRIASLTLNTCSILSLLSSDELNVEKEEEVYEAVMRWIQHIGTRRSVIGPPVAPYILGAQLLRVL